MDLKKYFRRIREIEAVIDELYTFVSSLETSDGGKPGIVTEVSRELAAKFVAEGRAVLASKVEKEQFLEQQSAARAAAQKAELTRKLQIAIVSDTGQLQPASQKK